jgi:Cd2+/Zn2+-exporting ATPase
MEVADITLTNGVLAQIPRLIDLSQRAMRTIRFNIAVSILVKIVFLVMVLTGHGTMWMAVLADVGTSLVVTANGMRLLRVTDETRF